MRNIVPKNSGYDDLIAGWRYCVTFDLRTPLEYLHRHGEFSPGPKEPPLVGPAENYLENGTAYNPYGIWVQEIDPKILPPSTTATRATQWGQVRIGSPEDKDLLSFLKSFRYIIETAETLDQKLAELTELSYSTLTNNKIWKKMKKSDPEFPDSFFYEELNLISGIGLKVAERLYRSGFRTRADIQSASDENLLKVQGVGKAILKKIRENL
jgi:predicted flap endonuclease-1-like 5' DNA nuclease